MILPYRHQLIWLCTLILFTALPVYACGNDMYKSQSPTIWIQDFVVYAVCSILTLWVEALLIKIWPTMKKSGRIIVSIIVFPITLILIGVGLVFFHAFNVSIFHFLIGKDLISLTLGLLAISAVCFLIYKKCPEYQSQGKYVLLIRSSVQQCCYWIWISISLWCFSLLLHMT